MIQADSTSADELNTKQPPPTQLSHNKALTHCGRTTPPSSFPKLNWHFSNRKQDVCDNVRMATDGHPDMMRLKWRFRLEQKTIRCQFLCLLSFLIKESRVADMAKPMLIMIKLHRRAQTS